MFYNVVMETVDISVGEFPPPEPEHAPAGEFAELLGIASSNLADAAKPVLLKLRFLAKLGSVESFNSRYTKAFQ